MPRYFTPSSLARKGRTEFVKDRCRRLGLPMLFYFYILGPLADFICRFTQKKAFSYMPDPGPAWFLLWLLMLSTIYAMADDALDETARPRPGWGRLMAFGLLASPLQLGLMFLCAGSFLFMPMSFGSLP